MPVPEATATLAEACGFTVHGWDDDDDSAVVQSATGRMPVGYGIEQPAVNYIGTKAECMAFMTAWQLCIQHKLTELMAKDDEAGARIRSTLIVLNARGDLEPGQSAQLTCRPQRGPFRGERIAVPVGIAEHFSICDIRVGNRSQIELGGDIPAVAFAVDVGDHTAIMKMTATGRDTFTVDLDRRAVKEFGRKYLMEACQVAQDLTIVAVNTSREPRPFMALILGRSAGIW